MLDRRRIPDLDGAEVGHTGVMGVRTVEPAFMHDARIEVNERLAPRAFPTRGPPVSFRYLPRAWLDMTYRNSPSAAAPCRASGAAMRRRSAYNQFLADGSGWAAGVPGLAARTSEANRKRVRMLKPASMFLTEAALCAIARMVISPEWLDEVPWTIGPNKGLENLPPSERLRSEPGQGRSCRYDRG